MTGMDRAQSGADAKTYKCPNCGGVIQYNIKDRRFLCTACKSEYKVAGSGLVREYPFDQYRQREQAASRLSGMSSVVCDNCGGEIFFESHETAKHCPMCGSSKVRDGAAASGIAPEGIVPFRIDNYDAQQRFRDWIRKRWFAPNQLKKAYAEGVLQGLYVPYWTYDAEARGDYAGQGGRTHTRRDREGNTRVETTWYPVSGTVYRSFDDLLVCASRNRSGSVIRNVAPYNTVSDISSFTPEYLSGYFAERYTIDGQQCFETARAEMESALHAEAHADIMRKGFSTAHVTSLRASYRNVMYKSVLLPLYTAQYGYADKTYSYAINGQTGKVSGNYPKSPLKIALAVLGVLLALGLLYFVMGESESGGSGGYYYSYSYRPAPIVETAAPQDQPAELTGDISF